jgi:hypothetical protein
MSTTAFDPQHAMKTARRRLRRAEAQAADGLAQLVDRVPDQAVDGFMRSPGGRLVVRAIFQEMPQRIDRKRAAGLDAIVRWQIQDAPGGRMDTYDLVFADGRAVLRRGHPKPDGAIAGKSAASPNPRLTITVTAAELLAIATGKSDPMQAYFKKRLQLGGDIMLAAKMASLFRMPPRRAPRQAQRPA